MRCVPPRKGADCSQRSGGGVVGTRSNLGARRENTSVEPSQRGACGNSNPDAMVWKGNAVLDPSQRGFIVLGAPTGSDEFVRTLLHATVNKHATLLQRILAVRDLQSAWLLLLYCAVPPANFDLRMVRPRLSEAFVQAHDDAVWTCFCQLVGIAGDSESARRAAGVPINLGGFVSGHWQRTGRPLGQLGRLHPERETKAPRCGRSHGDTSSTTRHQVSK